MTHSSRSPAAALRLAGLLYLVIIVCGLGAEMLFRGPLVDFGAPSATASAIRNAVGTFRLAIAADILMAAADAALAILLYIIFRPVAPVLALAAMVFRLIQSVMIAMNLMHMQSALLLITGVPGLSTSEAEAMALHALTLHAHGYDLGLVFFGINSLLTGYLIWLSGLFPRAIGAGVALAGLVYLTGSALRFFAPVLFDAFAPAYGVTILAEGAFCLILLSGWTRHRRIRGA
jgi:hypothetical protein